MSSSVEKENERKHEEKGDGRHRHRVPISILRGRPSTFPLGSDASSRISYTRKLVSSASSHARVMYLLMHAYSSLSVMSTLVPFPPSLPLSSARIANSVQRFANEKRNLSRLFSGWIFHCHFAEDTLVNDFSLLSYINTLNAALKGSKVSVGCYFSFEQFYSLFSEYLQRLVLT